MDVGWCVWRRVCPTEEGGKSGEEIPMSKGLSWSEVLFGVQVRCLVCVVAVEEHSYQRSSGCIATASQGLSEVSASGGSSNCAV